MDVDETVTKLAVELLKINVTHGASVAPMCKAGAAYLRIPLEAV